MRHDIDSCDQDDEDQDDACKPSVESKRFAISV
jgi:hypothetical protein